MTHRSAGVVVTTSTFGGAEKYLLDVYGHPRVRAEFEGTLLGELPGWGAQGLPAIGLGFGPKWSRSNAARALLALPATRRRGLAALDDFARRDNPAFMHLQFKREQILFSSSLSRHVPVLWTEHGGLPRFASWKAIARSYRRAARSTTTIICVAQHVADDLATLIGPGGPRLTVIEGGIDPMWILPASPAEREAARARLGVPQSAVVVASVARLVPVKRVGLLLDAVREHGDLFAIVCGDGPERRSLEASALSERTLFTGFLQDPRDVYRAADVIAFPSGAREGFPYGLLEAAAAGLPAAVVADSGLGASVAGWGEVSAEPGPAAFAAAILRARDRDAPSAPRAWAERHSLDRWIDAHLEVMRALAA